MMPDFKQFCGFSLFKGLPQDQLRAVFERVQVKSFPREATLLDSTSTELGLYFVVEGFVQILAAADGQEMVLSTLYPGDFFGETSVVEGGAPTAAVRAEEETVVYFLPRQEFLQLMESSSLLAAHFWESLSRHLIARMKKSNATIQEYFAVNRQLCENPKFRELYRLCQFGS